MARIRRWLIPFTALVLAVGAAPTVASAKNSQPPNPVTNVSAAARDGAVVISWRKPGRGPEPTAYVVTAAPGGKSGLTRVSLTLSVRPLLRRCGSFRTLSG